MNRAVIVLPTYNEAENVWPLVRAIEDAIGADLRTRTILLFVDGNSPDGTSEVVLDAMRTYDNVRLIVEEGKGGIGKAYLTGFHHAMKELNADVVIEFDADLQHPPNTIPVLLDTIADGADFVIGSRRIRGGSYPDHWNPKRLFLSRVGGLLAPVLLLFPRPVFFKVTDPTSGLRATRVKDVLDRIDLDSIRSHGFGYKIELLQKLSLVTPAIKEIPLRFEERTAGSSKMTDQTAGEVLRAVIWSRAHDSWTRQFLKFAVVGTSGLIVNALCLELFRRSGMFGSLPVLLGRLGNESAWSAAAAAEVSIVNNFLLNNFWTWSDRRAHALGKFLAKALEFNVATVGAILIQFLAIWAFTASFGDTTPVRQLGLLAAVLTLVVPYNWMVQKRLIWESARPRHVVGKA